ncbi:MAG: diaminopimelate epimerase, partial [Coxiellaceae bacterium]|nr:diaminopimelate epimerase [Coxiellaceae bacterium]
EFTIANVGNPHALIIVEDVDSANLLEYGELLTADPRFPEGVNVSVMSIEDRDSARLRVYERGVGPTQACGSAACAAMVLGFQQGLFDQKVTMLQPGGELAIAWQGHDSLIEMTGPAAFVFQGEYFSH